MTRVVRLDPTTGATRLSAAIDDAAPLMQRWGALLASESQRAFREQRFGEHVWPDRYPGQDEPFINFATVLMHANRGQEPKRRHLQRRPALIDEAGTGLRGSITWRVVGSDTVEVGSALPYASRHQWGGTDTQPVTPAAVDVLRKWIRTRAGRPYSRKLRWLIFAADSLTTTVHQRPFIGITDRAQDRLRRSLEDFVAERAGEAA